MTTTEAATQLTTALEAALATGELVREADEPANWFTFCVSEAEFEATPGEEQATAPEGDDWFRTKVVYRSDDGQLPEIVVRLELVGRESDYAHQ